MVKLALLSTLIIAVAECSNTIFHVDFPKGSPINAWEQTGKQTVILVKEGIRLSEGKDPNEMMEQFLVKAMASDRAQKNEG